MAKFMIAPPQLEPSNNTSWKKEMVFWEHATNVDKKKLAARVYLTLTGKAREAILEILPTDLNEEDGLSKLYSKLDELFKEDENEAALETYHEFERCPGGGGVPGGVMVKAMNCGIVVREFVLQSRYYVHFRANTLGKGMNPLILPPAMGK